MARPLGSTNKPKDILMQPEQNKQEVPAVAIESNDKPDIGPVPTQTSERWFPVVLKRHYRPRKDNQYRIIGPDGEPVKRHIAPEEVDAFGNKIPAGKRIELPIEEAKEIIRLGIADRADDIA